MLQKQVAGTCSQRNKPLYSRISKLPHKNANRFWKTPQAMLKPSFPFHLWGPEPVPHLG